LVKFRRRQKFPKNPQAREIPFKTISQCGSAISTPASSVPSGSCPLFGSWTRHFDTKAAIERTLASGPIVAARRGIAVEANHQSLLVEIY
jgi:hypothetical protein